MRKLTFPKGSTIYAQGEVINYVFIVKKGKVKLYFLDNGKEFSFDLVDHNEIFGGFGEAQEFAQSFEDSQIILISFDELRRLKRNTLLWILERMNQRYKISKLRMKKLAFMSLEDRIIHTALWLAQKVGNLEDGKIILNLSHEDFASFCGATRECVSKVLSQMKNSGLVETGRKKIVLYITEKSRVWGLL